MATPTDQSKIIGHFVEILNSHLALNLSSEDLLQIGGQVIKDELAFNEAAGLPSDTDKIYLPDFLCEGPLPPTKSTFDVDKDKIEKIWKT